MSILEKNYIVTMPDGEKWIIPVSFIANNRSSYYADLNFDGDIGRSLKEDTLPLFSSDDFEVKDWARNNMNWSDVKGVAMKVSDSTCDYQEGWVNGECEIVGL